MSNIVASIKGIISRNALLGFLLEDQTQEATNARATVILDLSQLLLRLPMSDEEVLTLFNSVAGRIKQKSCNVCGRLRPHVYGEMRSQMDLSKPKVFVCASCL